MHFQGGGFYIRDAIAISLSNSVVSGNTASVSNHKAGTQIYVYYLDLYYYYRETNIIYSNIISVVFLFSYS